MVLMYSPVTEPRITDSSVISITLMGIINHTHYKLKGKLKIENGKNIEQKIKEPNVLC